MFLFLGNGFELNSDSSGNSQWSTGLNRILTMQLVSFFYGKTKEIGYYDAILTDSELEYLTSYRSLSELVTELNLNTL